VLAAIFRPTARTPLRLRLAGAAVALVLTAFLAVPSGASAKTRRLSPIADSFVRADRPTAAAGGEARLCVRPRAPRAIAFLKFAPRVSAGRALSRATLRLYALGGAGSQLRLHAVMDARWRERSLSWRTAPARERGSAVQRISRRGWVSFDATHLIGWDGRLNLALTATGRRGVCFASRNAGAHRPVLVVVDRPSQGPLAPGHGPSGGVPSSQWPVQSSGSGSGGSGLGSGADPAAWRPIWDEEFSGTALDTSKWSPTYWTGSNSFYSPSNVSLSGGFLHLRAPTRSSSAMVQTLGKFALRSGRVEIAGKMPPGQGLWPALWLRPDDRSNYLPEYDILEMWNTDRPGDYFAGNVAWFTYHWAATPTRWEFEQWLFPAPVDYTAGFHVFALEWSPGQARWYVDGVQHWSVSGARVDATPMALVMSLQIGGARWIPNGDPNSNTPFPADMQIDYVRVYQHT
jgi:hypothetical protein